MDTQELITNYSEETVERISVLKKRKEHVQQQLQLFRFVWWGWILASCLGAGVYYTLIIGNSLRSYDTSILITKLVLGAFIGSFFYAYLVGAFRFMLSNRLRRIDEALVKAGAIELQESIDQNFFTKLVQINFKYLDQYYLQTQEQADKSFRLSAFAAISGLVIIVTGVLMMYYGKTEPAYVTTAAGVISEFIAAVFFYLYNRTILKMSQYHQKLVLTQNISLALKITDEMEKDQKGKALELLIDRLTTDVNKYLTDTKE
jgi:hypothetical protein